MHTAHPYSLLAVGERSKRPNNISLHEGQMSDLTDPKKSSLTLPIANMLPTSLLVPMSLIRKWVPFSIT